MLLKAKLKNVDEWKAVLNAIGDIVEDAMFIVNDDGITFRGIDPAHVALLDVTFPKSTFETLESQTSFFGLRVDDFKNVINSAGNGDFIELHIEKDDSMKIMIDGILRMEYTLKLLEKTGITTPIPKVDVKSKVTISPNVLAKILDNIEKMSEHVTINAGIDKIQFLGKGDVGNAKIDLEKTNPDLKVLNVSEESTSMYSLEYMAKIIRHIGRTCKSVDFEYGEMTPMHMLFELPSMARVDYYLAPRVEN